MPARSRFLSRFRSVAALRLSPPPTRPACWLAPSRLATSCLLFGASLSPALAQSAPPDASSIDLPEMVVSATRIATPEREVASSVTVITGEEITRTQERSLPDVLQSVPGLNVVQTGGPGGTTAVFMRGTDSGMVKVLVDGIEVNDPSASNGAFNLGQIMTNDISRIEVLRGPQSGLYGSDAIGGVISITTRRGEGPARITGFVEGGALGTFNQALGVSGGTQKVGIALNIGHFASTDIPVTPSSTVPPGYPRLDNAYDNWTYSGRLDLELSDAFSLNFTGRYIDSRLAYTPDVFSLSTSSYMPADQQSIASSQTFIGKAEGIWTALDGNLVSTFGIAGTDTNRPTTGPIADQNGTYSGDEQIYYWRSAWTVMKGQNLLFGVERKNQNMTSSTYYSSSDMTASTGDTGVYGQWQGAFGDRFFIAANVRYDSDDDFGDHTTYRIAPAYLIPETGTKLKATYGTGFKAPTLYQLYAPLYGNADLKPEESTGWDAGFEQALPGGRVTFGATYFHNDLTNLIGYDPVTFQSVNVSSATTKGVEAFVAVKVTDALSLRADYTYTDAVGTFGIGQSYSGACAPATDTTCNLLRRPANKFSIAANWQASDKLNLNATLVYVSSWWDVVRDTSDYVDQPGYTIVNVAANYAVSENATIYGRVDNLFDEVYQDPNGFLAPGLGAYGGVRFTF